MNINWRVRIKNKVFWLAFVPAMLMLVRAVLALFGVEVDVGAVQSRLLDIVEAVFAVLAILGVVVDPTTAGTGDSARAMTYTQPHMEEKKKR